jgi:predicted flavoprotein YhiN
MSFPDPESIVRRWWDAIDQADFNLALDLMHPTAVVDWPLSNERMSGPEAWKAVNEHYPGRWSAQVQSIVCEGATAVSRTIVSDGGITVTAISWFTFESGKIATLTEYWPETYAAPGWRAQWVEPIAI